MRIIFSKDRAAQLDLLMRTLDQHAWQEETRVLWYATTEDFVKGYLLLDKYRDQTWTQIGMPSELGRITPPIVFDRDLRFALAAAGPIVTFFCDDDVIIRPVPFDPAVLFKDADLLTFSWRLGRLGPRYSDTPTALWPWHDLPRTDHGYPGSIDGHVFRTADVQEMLEGEGVLDPTHLETILAQRCEDRAESRPLMGAFDHQVLVGVPVNRVSERSGCPHGEYFPQNAEDLNAAFLNGYRIDPGALDFGEVSGCHKEVEFANAWKTHA